jgi:hypothetical protein
MSNIDPVRSRSQPAMPTDSLTRAPLDSVGLQPTKNLLFIVRMYCPHSWFWTDILRPLVAFPSLLKEVGRLYVCLCPNIFVKFGSMFYIDVQVRSLGMIPREE